MLENVRHPFLADLAEPHRRFLDGCGHKVRFAAGEFLFREGAPADRLLLLLSGRVALELVVPGRGPVQMESLGPGDLVGLSWLFPPERWQLDARAVEPVDAVAFDGACLRAKMDADHDLGYALARHLLAQVYERLQRVRLQRLDLYRAEAR